ncbi:MAG: S41 family peptidase [Planctomycetota bacterium]
MPSKTCVIYCGLIAVVLLIAGSSCDSDSGRTPSSAAGTSRPVSLQTSPVSADTGLTEAVEKVCLGQFDQASLALTENGNSAAAVQMERLLDGHEKLQQDRQQQQQAAYREQLDKIKEIAEKNADAETADVNDIGETMLAAVRAREYSSDEAQKQEVLDDPFVRQLLAQMQAEADENEQAGKWLDAYLYNYSWLTALYEDDKTFEDKADDLTELATIELSIKDSSCGETAVERYEGINVPMFIRALQLLENNYVSLIRYDDMMRGGIERCILLGTVLERTTEDLAWSADKEDIAPWTDGLNAMLAQLDQDIDAGEKMTAEKMAVLFQDVLALGAQTIKLPQEVLIAQFTEASFAALDPFTNIIWPWNVKDFKKSMTQQFSGIGVEISKRTGVLKIVSLLPDTPAYRFGLDADDEIVAVENEPTEDMTIYCAVSKITGPKGTKVNLTIRRPSTGKTWDVTITRAKIVVDPLRGWTRTPEGEWDYMIDPDNNVGYIRLTSFTENTGPDLDSVLKKLEKKGLNGLILDLRFNGGGYLQAAADVVDMFVGEGVIVKSNPRQGFATYEIAHRSGTHPDYPLVVLINGSSASASEIVAGALQDAKHRRATLVGRRSYGKGSVQVVTGYTGDGSQMKYTVAYYHLPSDQRVKNRYQIEKLGRKDWGIAPDVEVELLSNEMTKMLEIQRDNDILFRDDHVESEEDEAKRHTLADTIKADPQLATSLMVVRSKMLTQGKTLVLNDEPLEEAASAVSVELKQDNEDKSKYVVRQ